MGRPAAVVGLLEPLSARLASSVVRPMRHLFLPASGMLNLAEERCPCNCSEPTAAFANASGFDDAAHETDSCVCPVRKPMVDGCTAYMRYSHGFVRVNN